MDIPLYFQGILMGLAIAAPVGPIGILCIRQTLTYGLLTGLVSGLGAATADGIYGSIAGLGLSAISDFLVNQQILLKVGGGLFLGYLGIRTFLSRADNSNATHERSERHTLLKAYSSTLALTLTNPATILSFTAIFAGLGIANHSREGALLLISGVFCGSALWWLLLSGGVAVTRDRVTPVTMRWINRMSGTIITAFGLLALLS
ncbi:MAG: LysE family transporter [Merismopedia sp. SIO2A8]|nr:LysE family transporter [Merismopedia sp. SIO2A8]